MSDNRIFTPARIAGAPAAPVFDMPDASHTFEERGGWLVKRLAADFGLQPFQAAGIVGNLGFESGGFKELQEIGVGSFEVGGYGWAQWTGPRRREFEAWCASQGLVPSSDEANYGYLGVELRGSYRGTIAAVSQTSNDADAVFSVGQTYERPGGTTSTFLPGFDGRLKYARRAMAGAGVVPPLPQPPLGRAALEAVVSAIMALQTALKPYGYTAAIDGIWGTGTEAALQAYLDQTGA